MHRDYLFLIIKFAVFGGSDRFENISTEISRIGDLEIAVCEFPHAVVVSRKSHEPYRGGGDLPGLKFREIQYKLCLKLKII